MRSCVVATAWLMPAVVAAQPAAEPPGVYGAEPNLRALTGQPTPIPARTANVAPAPAPQPAPVPVQPRTAEVGSAVPPRVGLQMHVVPLTSFAIPFGDATGRRRDSLGGRYGWQWVPLDLGLGAKVVDALYIGAYVSFGVGYEGSDSRTAARCDAGSDVEDDVSCSTTTVHAGVEARYGFTPGERLNGWVGYGFGLTSATQTISDAGRYRESTTARGLDVARLMGGLDFRPKRGFGLGPYGVVAIGRYLHTRTEIREDPTFSGDIQPKAFHAWVSLGLRLVVFP